MTTQVNWPEGYEPDNVAIYATNAVDIAATPETIWKRIVDAERWPAYYPHATDIRIANDEKMLGAGSRFTWKSMGGLDIVSWVTTYEPLRRIGWMAELANDPDATAYHEWVIKPRAGGCHVVSEETQKGAFFDEVAKTNRDDLHVFHQIWIERLRQIAEDEERSRR